MRLDPNPLFRRIMMPWYDSTPLCWLLFVAMFALVLFSWLGISIVSDNPVYQKASWMPWTLLVLSLYVLLSVSRRLICRYVGWGQRKEP